MQKPRPFIEGFTLIELLVAMVILAVVLGLVFNATMQTLSMQQDTERRVSIEAGLRRTVQIMTQDLRNAAYGMLTATPYASSSTSVSVTRMMDTAVHTVLGPTASFSSSSSVSALVPTGFAWPTNSYFLLINPSSTQKNATILQTTAAVSGANTVGIVHAGVGNTLCYSNDNLIQRVNLIGYTFNSSRKILYREVRSAQGIESSPVAFGVSQFQLTYIADNGTTYATLAAIPTTAQLARVGISITMERRGLGLPMSRTLTSTVEIPKVATMTLTNTPLKYIAPGTNLTCS